jgi:RimJ/RimL family protein N-acetyltransferase
MTNQEIILQNNRTLLRPLLESDLEHLLPFSLNEPELWKYSLVQAGGEENLKNYIKKALEAKEKEDSYPFIVFDKLTQRYAGSTRFYDIQEHHETAQIGYTWYGKEFQRSGLNRHCKLLMLQFAFEERNMKRVEFRADAKNSRSITAMKAIGCIEEGILRSNCAAPEGRRDSIVLSILKSDWESSVKEHLLSLTYI